MPRPFAILATLLLSASPALAQAPICGGISLVGEWVGGGEDASDVAVADALFEMEGRVPIAGHLVRMFTLSESAELRIDVDALPDGDPYIAVYDAVGAEVAGDDDSGENLGSRIEATFDPGTYCLAARSYGPGVTDVRLRIGRADHDFGGGSDEEVRRPPAGAEAMCFGDATPSLGDALDLAALADMPEGSGPVSQVPAYGFTLLEPSPLTITASSDNGDPFIRLLREGTGLVAENDDFDGLNSRIDLSQPLEAGRYCVEVEDLNATGDAITVRLAAFDAAADRLRRLGLAEFAPGPTDAVPIVELGTLGTTLLHEVAASETATWLRFDLAESGLLLLEAIGNGSDPIVTLFDRVGRRLGENDDGPAGLDSFLVSKLSPGEYLVSLRLLDGAAQRPVRLLLERYVPAP